MKVLFAVNNDNISNTIMTRYQKDYKEIISLKNVYYFNAILKELQKDKTYDRIVISEDLEPFANNNFDTIDKFLFDKLEKIKDEATKANGEAINIILVCVDRRKKSDEMTRKLFEIGIYDALLGEERSIANVCKLINIPRTKKEAKIYYKVENTTQIDDENSVSEAEVQNILAHYKRLGKNEEKYVDSFNNIVSQYTDAQLKIIIRYLPIGVKAVLEEKSQKYQQLVTFDSNNTQKKYAPITIKTNDEQKEKINIRMLKEEKRTFNKPVVIPSSLDNKKIIDKKEQALISKENEIDEIEEDITEKRGRGRPRKNPIPEIVEDKPKKGRGRPKKNVLQDEEEIDFNLFDLDDDNNDINNELEEQKHEQETDIDIFSMENEDEELDLFSMEQEDTIEETKEKSKEIDDNTSTEYEEENILFEENNKEELEQINEQNEEETHSPAEDEIDLFSVGEYKEEKTQEQEKLNLKETTIQKTSNLNTLLTKDKKIVSFVGTTKNGTSFVINNLALVLSEMNISTAILDITKSKNAYYIFTKNEENLRNIAENSIINLEKGIDNGICVNKNLTVYTEIPDSNSKYENVENILATLLKKHDVILIDTDFTTPIEFFENSQEIYLVQSMDILTIQPLTAFLRNLKSKNVLTQEKIKIIINKGQKIRTLSDKILIGGMSSYNDPGMSFMTELFDKDNVQYCKISFEMQNYVKYLDSLVNCNVSLKGYTKNLLTELDELAQMVYPLLNKPKYTPFSDNKKRMEFSEKTKSTLSKMRNNF